MSNFRQILIFLFPSSLWFSAIFAWGVFELTDIRYKFYEHLINSFKVYFSISFKDFYTFIKVRRQILYLHKKQSSQNWNGSQNAWDNSNLVLKYLFFKWFFVFVRLIPRIICLLFSTAYSKAIDYSKISCKNRSWWSLHRERTHRMSFESYHLRQVYFLSL